MQTLNKHTQRGKFKGYDGLCKIFVNQGSRSGGTKSRMFQTETENKTLIQ